MKQKQNLLNKLLKSFSGQQGLEDLLAQCDHPNGYKRENAVRRLGMLGNPLAIAALLLRANDWVPQVRQAAREALEKLLTKANAEAFVYCLPDLYHLQNCGRDDHSALIELVKNFLLQGQNQKHIIAAIELDNPYIARIAVQYCIENTLLDEDELVTKCFSHKDVLVRNTAAGLLRNIKGEALERLLAKALCDSFMPVRREAFQICLRTDLSKGLKLAQQFLFDRHMAIREIAIKKLLENDIDVETILLAVLRESNQTALKTRCAICGLGDINARAQVSLIEGFLNHQLPGIRKVALQALVKLRGEDSKPFIVAGLQDSSPAVAKEAMRLISNTKMPMQTDELLGIIEAIHYPHTLLVCLRAARPMNKWDRLILLLSLTNLLSSTDGEDWVLLLRELGDWNISFNKTWVQPNKPQIKRLETEYAACRHQFDEQWKRSLDFTMKGIEVSVEK